MRTRTMITGGTVAAAVLTAMTGFATAQSPAARAVPVCKESAVKVRASGSGTPGVLRIGFTNTSARTCAVDRLPTVAFGDLDGAAQPVPPADSAPYKLAPGRAAYAAVRTAPGPGTDGEDAKVVDTVRVAADPSHTGREFAFPGTRVWEPVTTWWHPSRAKADNALRKALG
ncbi:DUF4232 domain-containing protein [Streptomyces sp. GC420]|uniref:DUF4232 domain-containing protein n=1 Tax=Streptomyces sp. GC420 TaxID=2697568 RepID=UPI0014151914|nr:DUF4232 domain-containing protein [Streptomyces sp. GC420]NBM20561.1 DUF4232 domain-containing protein [Streptomyces sp. GC420]